MRRHRLDPKTENVKWNIQCHRKHVFDSPFDERLLMRYPVLAVHENTTDEGIQTIKPRYAMML